jgi:DNA-binding LytR/AlgR family response regulator
MWRLLLLLGLLTGFAAAAHAQETPWQVCRGAVGADGPVLTDCRPLDGVIDPQGRELWIRSTMHAPTDDRPRALYVFGAMSSEAWLNGRFLGANGRPAATAGAETPGLYQASWPIRETLWRPGDNEIVLRLSAHHVGLRFATPVGAIVVAPYPFPSRAPLLAVTFTAAGCLLAAAFGFGAIHAMRRTGSSLMLAAMSGVAALQAIVENLRPLVPYAYPLHAWRVATIWVLAAAFAILLVAFAAARFLPRARLPVIAAAVLVVGATWLLPGFDHKTGWALILGATLAAAVAGAGVYQRLPGARLALGYLAAFLATALAFPLWLVDLSFFLLAAILVLPLLMAEVVRLGRDDRAREAALTRAASRPDRLTVASARGVELVSIPDIVAAVGADDYVELRLAGGRNLLHATRLERLEAQLPSSFLRIHRSVIANLSQVRSLERDGGRWRLHMREGPPLPVSRSRLPALREAIDEPAPLRATA